MKAMKISLVVMTLLALGICAGCHKEPARPEVSDVEKKRDVISYDVTIVPRAEAINTGSNNLYNGDTLRVKVNGNLVFYIKNSITANYYSSGMFVNGYTLPKVQTGQTLEVYYDPGRVTLGNGTTTYDDNGMAIYLTYNGTTNTQLWKEFNCRCIGYYSATLP